MNNWVAILVQNTGKASVLVGIGIGLASLIIALGRERTEKPSVLDRCIAGSFPKLCEILGLSVAGGVVVGYVVLVDLLTFGDVWRILLTFALFLIPSIVVIIAIDQILKKTPN